MSGMLHVQSVQIHLASFLDEALALGLTVLAGQLEKAAADLQKVSLKVEGLILKKETHWQAMKKMEARLVDYLGHSTMEMAFVLPETDYAALLTGRHLSVSNRLRYRYRQLQKLSENDPKLVNLCASHGSILGQYDSQIDHFLESAALLSYFQQEALSLSQHLRPFLWQSKKRLLEACELDSPRYKRIKKRVVRTKKALWLSQGRGDQRDNLERFEH